MLYQLIMAIRDFLAAELSTLYQLEPCREQEKIRAPEVFIGSLPPKRPGAKDDFPYVIVRSLGGQDEGGEADATVQLVCGVWNQESAEAGENDLVNLVSACRTALLRRRTLNGRFALKPDERGRLLAWRKPEDQPDPYYVAEIMTRWEVPIVEQELTIDAEVDTYGSGYE